MIKDVIKKNKKKNEGFSFVEIVIGSSIFLLVFSGLISTYNFMIHSALKTSPALQATFIAEEGIEAVMILRDFGWTSEIAPLAVNQSNYLSWNGTRFVSTPSVEVIDGRFTRSFVLENVLRDSNDDISDSGAVDPGTKKVTVKVDYVDAGSTSTTTKQISTYITNLYND